MAESTELGRFVWYDLMSPHTEAAKRFYTKVLGWGTQVDRPLMGIEGQPPYTMWTAGDAPIAGIVPFSEEYWLGYVGVADVGRSAMQAKDLGGKVLYEVTGLSRLIIVDSPDEKKQPTVEIKGKNGDVVRRYILPVNAHLMVQDGETVYAGDVLAKIPRETTKTKDITGGLPRVVELFEARKPKDPAVISEIDGTVKYGGVVKDQRKVLVVRDDPNAEPREYSIPRGVHVNVQETERVHAGDPLMDGPSNPHDILHVLGENELQKYMVNEIQEVYRLQGVNINDKHIEVITRQMMRWVRIEDVGDTEFLIDEQVDKFRFLEENERVIKENGRPASAQPLLLGITKASLSTESFMSAASFQETTRVLTEAAISGNIDYLRGLKENVTMGRLIPAGTGFWWYRHVQIPPDEPPPPPPVIQPSDEDMDLDHMEYLAEPEEALEPRGGDEGI